MADTVDTITLFSGTRRKVYRLLGWSDGTGETAVVKVDKSTLTNGNGVEPTKIGIEWIEWDVQGFANVKLLWDNTADDEIMSMSGRGEKDFREVGGLWGATSATTGDILLTSPAAAATGTYDIVVSVLLSN